MLISTKQNKVIVQYLVHELTHFDLRVALIKNSNTTFIHLYQSSFIWFSVSYFVYNFSGEVVDWFVVDWFGSASSALAGLTGALTNTVSCENERCVQTRSKYSHTTAMTLLFSCLRAAFRKTC